MKTIFSIFALFLILTAGSAQKQDIEVFENKDGSKVIVVARNTGAVDYKVTLQITSIGMNVSPSSRVEVLIPAGFMKEMATLDPRAGENWEYSYDVSFAKSIVKKEVSTTTTTTPTQAAKTSITPAKSTTPPPPPPVLSTADIILYSKPNCGRCALVKKQLISQNIIFEEYSTTSPSPEISNMWAQLRNSGFSGGSVTMPVVRANGKYYYNIPDLNGFVAGLKKS